MLTGSGSCGIPDILVHLFTDQRSVMRGIEAVWNTRIRSNYRPRPVYFAIAKTSYSSRVRYEIERMGAHFLYLFDVPTHFQRELDQIRLELGPVVRSLPQWRIVQEGNGSTLRVIIYLMGRRRAIRVGGSDRLAVVLASLIRNNGMTRSISAWQKVLADEPFFTSAGGGFEVPSRSSLKMYLHRDFPRYLQRSFNDERSGYCIEKVIECVNPGTWATEYRIRGEWSAIHR
jgi:hypothetical protein